VQVVNPDVLGPAVAVLVRGMHQSIDEGTEVLGQARLLLAHPTRVADDRQ
jgi:hypothetical protein